MPVVPEVTGADNVLVVDKTAEEIEDEMPSGIRMGTRYPVYKTIGELLAWNRGGVYMTDSLWHSAQRGTRCCK
jgi:hypothetical protein